MKGKRLLAYAMAVGALWGLLWSACDGPAVRLQSVDTFYSQAGDGGILGTSSTSYASARDTADDCQSGESTEEIGQKTSNWTVWRAYLSFDTSSIPDDATVLSATLQVCAAADNSTTDFDLVVYAWDWSAALCDSTEANYDGAYGGGATRVGVLRNTADGWSDGTYYPIAITPTLINLSADTRFTLLSDEDENDDAPSNAEYVSIYSSDEAGTSKDPFLVVSYTTPTPTPTATPLCSVHIDSDTTWGPGAVRVGCNVGVATGVTLTVAAGTEVRFTGDWKMDVKGRLYAMGTVTEPITITHETLTTTHSYGWIYLRGGGSTLDYVNIYHGSGLNLADESTITHCTVMTNAYGLAVMGPWAAEVTSCTVQYNDYGLYLYNGAQPAVQHCNVLSNTVYDVEMHQPEALTTSGCWWGSDPPDEAHVWDADDDLTLGDVGWSDYAAAWVNW